MPTWPSPSFPGARRIDAACGADHDMGRRRQTRRAARPGGRTAQEDGSESRMGDGTCLALPQPDCSPSTNGESSMRRRDFTKLAAASAVGAVAAPAIARAQTTFNWKMTSFYGPNAAFYSTGPGSAKDLVKRIDDMSGGRIKIQFYGAGELIPAAEGFDAVSSGTVEMNYANSYF